MHKDPNHYKTKLEEERKTLINELQSVAVHTESKDKDDWEATPMTEVDSADSNNVADRISSYENNDAIVRDLENRLREVDHALLKIENNTYGICEIDNEPIEEDRLEANPAARTCKKHLNERLGSPQI
jgi:DnaK suppressor protein